MHGQVRQNLKGMGVNENYLQAFSGIVDEWQTTGKIHEPLFTESALLLPIRLETQSNADKIAEIYIDL